MDLLKKDKPVLTEAVNFKCTKEFKQEMIDLCKHMDWDFSKFIRYAIQESMDSVRKENK